MCPLKTIQERTERWWFRKSTAHHSGIYSTLRWIFAIWVISDIFIWSNVLPLLNIFIVDHFFFLDADYMLHLIHHFWHLKGTPLLETVGLPFNYSAGDKGKMLQFCRCWCEPSHLTSVSSTLFVFIIVWWEKNKAAVIMSWKGNLNEKTNVIRKNQFLISSPAFPWCNI